MKLIVILITTAIMQVSASSFAQKITLDKKSAPLSQIINEIRNQSGYDFFYNKTLLKSAKPVTIKVHNVTIEEALEACFRNQPLEFQIEDKTVMIKEKEKPVFENIVVRFQAIDVRGKVLDENGQPLGGANVKVKEMNKSTTTNAQGEFYLQSVDEEAVLIISFIGYKAQEIKAQSNSMEVRMKLETSSLEEVKVSGGYYEVENSKRTGNIFRVDGKDIERQPISSPLLALQGRIPGVEITPTSGTPGAAVRVQIRGQNSLRTSEVAGIDGNLPLYVVNGIPVNSTPVFSMSQSILNNGLDPLSNIDPANIESIEVLKDADATAIYGSRGANGVILITTKSKSNSRGLNLDVNFYQGIGDVPNRFSLLTREQYLEMREEAARNDGGTALSRYNNPSLAPRYYPDVFVWDTTRYTNWQDVLVGGKTNVANLQTHIDGGNAQTSFRLGGAYYRETIPFPGDFSYKRYSADFNLTHKSQDNRLSLVFSANYGVNDNNVFDSFTLMSNSLWLPPIAPKLYDETGALNWQVGSNGRSTWVNPMSLLRSTHVSDSYNLLANSTVEYKILDELRIKTSLGLSRFDQSETLNKPISSLNPYGFDELLGTSYVNSNTRSSWIAEPQLVFSKRFGSHKLDATIGMTVQQANSDAQGFIGERYSSDALLGTLNGATTIRNIMSTNSQYRYGAVYGRAAYEFNGKYLVSITGRRDGSSRFGPDNRYGNFWAVGGAWIFSNEKLLKGNHILSFGKIRGSYGITGNDQIGDSRYIKSYKLGDATYNGLIALQPTGLSNADYAWEVTKKAEIAFEVKFIDRISIEAAWYNNRSSNQLIEYKLPAVTGFSGVISNFDALIENKGFEVLLRTENIRNKNFKWTTSFNISLNKNELVDFPGIEESSYFATYKEGKPLSIRRTYLWNGVDATTGLHTFKDLNGDKIINSDDQTFSRSLATKYFGGFNNIIAFKGLELDFLFQFSDRIANVGYFPAPGTLANQPSTVLDRWQKAGDITSVQRFTTTGAGVTAYNNWRQSDAVLENIRFLKLRTLSLSYLLPQTTMNRIGIDRARVFIQGQNLFTKSNFTAWDPETLYGVPPSRFLTMGVEIRL